MLPKRRVSKGRKRRRRAHQFLTPAVTVVCKHCNHVTLPHRICGNCGWYQGRQVVVTAEEK
jgi:large subunit ribosomal protein L32